MEKYSESKNDDNEGQIAVTSGIVVKVQDSAKQRSESVCIQKSKFNHNFVQLNSRLQRGCERQKIKHEEA